MKGANLQTGIQLTQKAMKSPRLEGSKNLWTKGEQLSINYIISPSPIDRRKTENTIQTGTGYLGNILNSSMLLFVHRK